MFFHHFSYEARVVGVCTVDACVNRLLGLTSRLEDAHYIRSNFS